MVGVLDENQGRAESFATGLADSGRYRSIVGAPHEQQTFRPIEISDLLGHIIVCDTVDQIVSNADERFYNTRRRVHAPLFFDKLLRYHRRIMNNETKLVGEQLAFTHLNVAADRLGDFFCNRHDAECADQDQAGHALGSAGGRRLTKLALNPRAREGRADPSPSVAERPAIRPTRWRRLLAAVADSFFAKFRFGRTLMMMLLLLLRLAAAQRRGQR